ncbi:hypothetical protein [Amaricoccus sp.]|uniref:hypothetical protein n=1 Tax=Amaricoccus sp. TaxID=1872485 RepID=UPI001B3E2435|nr:hypothetical protein [Amaricoccus sp.]MBP7003389.1 hypothetical protein [Amaricoccus sp.]
MPRAPSSPLAQRIEWVVAAASAAIVASVIGYLVRDGLRDETPPDLQVEAAPYDPATRRLAFILHNAGGTAANAVVVSAVAADGARASLTIDFAPPGSEVAGAFLLDAPAEIVVDGYVDP